jgi:hypothetical protein
MPVPQKPGNSESISFEEIEQMRCENCTCMTPDGRGGYSIGGTKAAQWYAQMEAGYGLGSEEIPLALWIQDAERAEQPDNLTCRLARLAARNL